MNKDIITIIILLVILELLSGFTISVGWLLIIGIVGYSIAKLYKWIRVYFLVSNSCPSFPVFSKSQMMMETDEHEQIFNYYSNIDDKFQSIKEGSEQYKNLQRQHQILFIAEALYHKRLDAMREANIAVNNNKLTIDKARKSFYDKFGYSVLSHLSQNSEIELEIWGKRTKIKVDKDYVFETLKKPLNLKEGY